MGEKKDPGCRPGFHMSPELGGRSKCRYSRKREEIETGNGGREKWEAGTECLGDPQNSPLEQCLRSRGLELLLDFTA